jgi:hypothetical protein
MKALYGLGAPFGSGVGFQAAGDDAGNVVGMAYSVSASVGGTAVDLAVDVRAGQRVMLRKLSGAANTLSYRFDGTAASFASAGIPDDDCYGFSGVDETPGHMLFDKNEFVGTLTVSVICSGTSIVNVAAYG